MKIDFSPIPPVLNFDTTMSKPGTDDGVFRNMIESSVGKVEELRKTADQTVAGFLGGEQEDTHTVVMATQRAELAFDLFLQVRNKVVQAYQEVMRMQM